MERFVCSCQSEWASLKPKRTRSVLDRKRSREWPRDVVVVTPECGDSWNHRNGGWSWESIFEGIKKWEEGTTVSQRRRKMRIIEQKNSGLKGRYSVWCILMDEYRWDRVGGGDDIKYDRYVRKGLGWWRLGLWERKPRTLEQKSLRLNQRVW